MNKLRGFWIGGQYIAHEGAEDERARVGWVVLTARCLVMITFLLLPGHPVVV